MKKRANLMTITMIAFMAICTLPTFGQGGGQGGGRPGGGQGGGRAGGGMDRQMTEEDIQERVKRSTQDLNITEAQEKLLVDFELKEYKKGQIERQKFQGDREQMRTYMTKQREVRDAKYKEVLTEEQYKKYEENQQQRRQNRPSDNRQQPTSGDRPARGRG